MIREQVPYFRPSITEDEINEVVATLRSGWLTSGPRVQRFEQEFAAAVGARYAIAVNSCTAALHLAVEALGLADGQAVLVPTMTFAATAEIVRYMGAIPIAVDCDRLTANMELDDAEEKLNRLRTKGLNGLPPQLAVVGIIPVHVGGLMMDVIEVQRFAAKHNLWVVDDAAHAMPAAWRAGPDRPWQRCGEGTASISCFSFYANKTITTGEGGMVVTDDPRLAQRIRLMSLHGLSNDAWGRYETSGSWDYKILAPGFKYNLTDIAAAIGIHQLSRAEEMRLERERIAEAYRASLVDLEEIELPPVDNDRLHSWHLFPIKLRLDCLSIDRSEFIKQLKQSGIGCSVHWRPLHLHPYYRETLGWEAKDLPIATSLWQRLISLPIFPSMKDNELERVVQALREICLRYSRLRKTPSKMAVTRNKTEAVYSPQISQ